MLDLTFLFYFQKWFIIISTNKAGMHLLQFAFYLTGITLISLQQPLLLFVFLGVIVLYLIIAEFYPGAKNVSNRRKIMFASWSPPSEGIIQAKVEINMEKTLKFLQKYPEDQRPTVVHVVCKAGAEVIKDAEDLNGKIVFGKFLKFKHVNLGMLAELGEGKEMVNILIQKAQNKSIQQIRDESNKKIANIKKSKAQKTQLGRFVPTFMMELFLKLLQFVTGDLNISIPFLGIKSSPYGAAMLHSLEGIQCNDATAPFLGYSGCSVQVTINRIHQKVIVEDGKATVAKVMIANFIVDHRYLDGARAKKMIPNFMKVFENPEQYSEMGKEGSTEMRIV